MYKLFSTFMNFDKNNIYDKYIYLDNNATTKPCEEAIKLYNENLFLGNASSLYATKCYDIINNVKDNILLYMGLSNFEYTVIFTSCASESINTFFNTMYQYNKNIPIVTSSYEHVTTMLSINKKFNNIIYVEPNIRGIITIENLNDKIKQCNEKYNSQEIIVNIMQTNNELGSTNFIKKEQLVSRSRIIYHSDIVQAFSKYPINKADIYSISFHKLYGMAGAGALVIRNNLLYIFLKYPQINGHQNNNLRGGTENIAMIASIGAALKSTFNDRINKNISLNYKKNIILINLSKNNNVIDYVKYYDSDIKEIMYPYEIIVFHTNSINTIYMFIIYSDSVVDVSSIKMQKKLLDNGIIVSTGSACNKGKRSHVLSSVRVPESLAKCTLRISLGDYNTVDDCVTFCNVLKKTILSFIH